MSRPPPDEPAAAPETLDSIVEEALRENAFSEPAAAQRDVARDAETWAGDSHTSAREDARASPDRARASAETEGELPAPAPGPSTAPSGPSEAVKLGYAPSPLPARYGDRGLLGMGGMGEVRRVYDRVLDRMVAMKLIRRDRQSDAHHRHQFAQEARATARLAHPGIVPVYDQGVTDDGRPWFTMQEVRGETLSVLIARLHAVEGDRDAGRQAPPPGFRRLVDHIERAARAVAYAHQLGAVHQDIKPANVLVGEHGEVMVVDWGLMRTAGVGRGGVHGTPCYMAPEQARGAAVDARSDVYGLGMVLWELCAGNHPYPGARTDTVLSALGRGEVPGPPPSPWLLPDELLGTLLAATDADPARRPGDGAVFANQLRAWLDGEHRRERARARLETARQREREITVWVAEEAEARQEVARLSAENRPSAPDTTRAALWAAEDHAAGLARRISTGNREVVDALEAALIHDPDLVEAHAMLARRLREAQAEAERQGQLEPAADLEVRLRRHVAALPAEHRERVRAEAWLRGDGRLDLVTDPPGARAELFRYVTRRRRLVPERVGDLGFTPLTDVSLPRGSYLIVLHPPDGPGRFGAPVRYPVWLGREQRWHGRPPGHPTPHPIYLPGPGELGPDDLYVPAGPAVLGGDPLAPGGLPARELWVDGFVIRKFPVTNREYVHFLNTLVDRGERALAERYAPRGRGNTPGTWGVSLYNQTEDGHFFLGIDPDGDRWDENWPVILIDHAAAWAFAYETARQTGLPWRLPGELEWEKAARGVDQRPFPWGDFADTTWCANRLAFDGAIHLEPIGSRPTDESPYGVRDLAGGVLDWTASRMRVDGPPAPEGRVLVVDGAEETEEAWLGRSATWRVTAKGGSILHDLNAARVGFRLPLDPWNHSSNVGFRLARSI